MAENGNGGATTAELVPVGMAPSTLAQGLMRLVAGRAASDPLARPRKEHKEHQV